MNGLLRFGEAFDREAAKEIPASLDRMRDHAQALTPVRTGRMRRLIRVQPTGRHAGFMGWIPGDFRELGQAPYYWWVVMGRRATETQPARAGVDPLTPSLEGDRPFLLRGLQAAAFRAARSVSV